MRLNAEIVAGLHEEGRVAPSLTTIAGRTAIRAAIVNHSTAEDVDALVRSALAQAGPPRAVWPRRSCATPLESVNHTAARHGWTEQPGADAMDGRLPA